LSKEGTGGAFKPDSSIAEELTIVSTNDVEAVELQVAL
jgi:hypothetical protein